jgi:hypothetical protein
MTLTTLTGTTSHTDLNNNFSDKLAAIRAVNDISSVGKTFDKMLDCDALSSATLAGLRQITFTPEDDYELIGAMLRVTSGTASITITASIKAILPDTEEEVPKYLSGDTFSMSLTTIVGTNEATRVDKTSVTAKKLYLIKGITYRLILTSSSATAVTRAYAKLILRVRRRRN